MAEWPSAGQVDIEAAIFAWNLQWPLVLLAAINLRGGRGCATDQSLLIAEMSEWTHRGHFICEMDKFKKDLHLCRNRSEMSPAPAA